MKKTVFLTGSLISMQLMATTVDLQHPNQLIEKFQACQVQTTSTAECREIKRVVTMIHHNVVAMQHNQQAFGLEIMELQNQIQALKTEKSHDFKKIDILQEQLDVMLATVSWLESPK